MEGAGRLARSRGPKGPFGFFSARAVWTSGSAKIEAQRSFLREVDRALSARLNNITPNGFKRLTWMAPEVHDLVLAKPGRNSPRDRSDVEFLGQKRILDAGVLRERFETELRPYVLNEARAKATLDLWLDEFLPFES